MSKKAPKSPPPPDPAIVAGAQAAANADTARLQNKMNLINQYDPYGSIVYNPIGDDRYERRVNLTPQGQSILDSENKISEQLGQLGVSQLGRIGSNLNSEFNFDGLPGYASRIDTTGIGTRVQQLPGAGEYGQQRNRIEDEMFKRVSDRMTPRFEREQASLEQKLANQGLMRGSEAYTNAMRDFSEGKNDFFRQAASDAILAGGAEQSRLADMDARAATFANQARQQGFAEQQQQAALQNAARQQGAQERQYLRSLPMNELIALMSGTQLQGPQSGSTPLVSMQAPDVQGAYAQQYAGALNNYNQQMAARNSGYNTLGQLAGTVAGAYFGGPIGASVGSSLFRG